MNPSCDIERLIEIMAALRTPGTGCPWDLEQHFASIAPYTIEEAYEVADAIARGDLVDLKDELGDLLLQVVFHARMAQEQGSFAFPDVVEAITTKLIRTHPHVFGDARDLSPAEVKALWGQIKAQEKADKARARAEAGLPEPPEAPDLPELPELPDPPGGGDGPGDVTDQLSTVCDCLAELVDVVDLAGGEGLDGLGLEGLEAMAGAVPAPADLPATLESPQSALVGPMVAMSQLPSPVGDVPVTSTDST